jgi:hypothetical protein
MSNKTLTQCYELQDQLFTAFEREVDNDIKARLACAWDKITTKQRIIRGVPPLKPVEARQKLKRVASSPAALTLPDTTYDAVVVNDASHGQPSPAIPSYVVPDGVAATTVEPTGEPRSQPG